MPTFRVPELVWAHRLGRLVVSVWHILGPVCLGSEDVMWKRLPCVFCLICLKKYIRPLYESDLLQLTENQILRLNSWKHSIYISKWFLLTWCRKWFWLMWHRVNVTLCQRGKIDYRLWRSLRLIKKKIEQDFMKRMKFDISSLSKLPSRSIICSRCVRKPMMTTTNKWSCRPSCTRQFSLRSCTPTATDSSMSPTHHRHDVCRRRQCSYKVKSHDRWHMMISKTLLLSKRFS